MPLGRMNATALDVSLRFFTVPRKTCLFRLEPMFNTPVQPSLVSPIDSAHIYVLHEFRISQSEQIGDSSGEMLNIQIVRDAGAASVSLFIPDIPAQVTQVGLPLAGSQHSTSGLSNTAGKDVSAGGLGTGFGDVVFSDTWNTQFEFLYLPLPDARIVQGAPHPGFDSSTEGLEVTCSAPSGELDTVRVSAVWEEIPFTLDAFE